MPPSTIIQRPARRAAKPLTAAMATGYTARQVFDLPEPTPLIVTEHRAHDCRCAAAARRRGRRSPKG